MENDAEYQNMVQRELMVLRAKKEAADLFRQEEVVRARADHEEQIRLEQEEARAKLVGTIDAWCRSLRLCYENNHTIAIDSDKYALDFKRYLGLIHYYQKKANVERMTPAECAQRAGIPLPSKLLN